MGLINEFSTQKGVEIGKIDMMKKFSFFEIENQHAEKVFNAFKNKKFSGRDIVIDVAQPAEEKPGSKTKKGKKKQRTYRK